MKFIEHIKAVETGNRRIIEQPLYKIRLAADGEAVAQFQYAREYAITATLGANQFIAEDLIKRAGAKVIDQAVNEMKHAIVEVIYGELKRDLLELRMKMRFEQNHAYDYQSPTIEQLDKIIEKISL